MSPRTLAKRLALCALALAGYAMLLPLARRFRIWKGSEQFRVFNYHSISTSRKHPTTVDPDAFEAHMRLLSRKAMPVTLDAILSCIRERGALPSNAVTVTLDDGYADNLHVAQPILGRHRVPATCFLTASVIGTDKLLPHDAGEAFEAARLLSWDEARELRDRGVDIGSHAQTHTNLARVASREALAFEIEGSLQEIRRRLGQPPRSIAFPFGQRGDYSAATVAAARNAGYHCAFTARYGWNSAGTPAYELYRIGVDGCDNLFTLRAKMNGALDLLVVTRSARMRALISRVNSLLGCKKQCAY